MNSTTVKPDISDGHIETFRDDGWDKPLVESKERDRYNEIDDRLYHPGLMCRIYGGEYIFIDTSNYWCNLASIEAMGRINSMVGILNASVNIEKAMKQFHRYIVKRCNVKVGMAIPTSVCFGTRRLEIEIDDTTGTITLQSCKSLLPSTTVDMNPIVKSVCIMPIDTDTIPRSYVFPGKGEILSCMMKLFPDARSLLTILWHIGNCLVDPVSRPRCLMACGPGGSGKSTLLQQIFSCLTGCSGVLPDGSLVGHSRSMIQEICEVIASCRMAVCYDVDLEKEPLNMSVYKNISGSDYVRVGYNSIKTNCSLTLGTNGLVNIDKQPEYLEDAIMRRTISVLMNVNALAISRSVIPEDSESRVDFCCAAIYSRMMYEHLPISPNDLLLTMCQSRIDDAIRYIEETSGDINVLDGIEVLKTLSAILNITPHKVIFKAKLISPMSVLKCGRHSILRGLTVRKHHT